MQGAKSCHKALWRILCVLLIPGACQLNCAETMLSIGPQGVVGRRLGVRTGRLNRQACVEDLALIPCTQALDAASRCQALLPLFVWTADRGEHLTSVAPWGSRISLSTLSAF